MTQFSWGGDATQFFFDLTPEKILAAVETFGFKCTGRVLPLNSFENRVYEVEIETDNSTATPSDKFKIIKFYRPGRWTKEQILEEHEFLFDVASEEVAVVTPLVDENKRSLKQVELLPIYYAVFPKFGGRSWDEIPPDDRQMLGRLIGKIHAIGKTKPFKHRIPLNAQTYGFRSLEFLAESKKIASRFETEYVKSAEAICHLAEKAFENIPTQRVHGDCHLGNLLYGSKAGLSLVDFDDSVTAPCVQDLWLFLPGRDLEGRIVLEEILEGYDQMNSFPRNTLSLIEFLRPLRWIHYHAWILKRWEDPVFPKTFPQVTEESFWEQQVSDLQRQLHLIENL